MRSDKFVIKNFRASGATVRNQRFNWQKGRAKNLQYEKRSIFYVKVRIFRIRTLPDFGHGTPLNGASMVHLLFNERGRHHRHKVQQVPLTTPDVQSPATCAQRYDSQPHKKNTQQGSDN